MIAAEVRPRSFPEETLPESSYRQTESGDRPLLFVILSTRAGGTEVADFERTSRIYRNHSIETSAQQSAAHTTALCCLHMVRFS